MQKKKGLRLRNPLFDLVGGAGFEPATNGLKVDALNCSSFKNSHLQRLPPAFPMSHAAQHKERLIIQTQKRHNRSILVKPLQTVLVVRQRRSQVGF